MTLSRKRFVVSPVSLSVWPRSSFGVVAALLLAAGLAGCAEYMDRKDTLAFSAGDAVQTNVVTHVPDPWPSASRSRDIAFSGERMQSAVERYRTYDPKPEAPPSIIINTR